MTADEALRRARTGDGQAFAELVQPYRRELHVHCYRMLGSFDDADDAPLAFITALQLLSPRARAVLGFTAREVAVTLDSTEDAVAMTLSRARAAVRNKVPRAEPADTAVARRLADALTAHDIDRVVSLLTEDVRIAMPPLPAIWSGRARAAEFLAEVAFRLVPEARFVGTQANGQPALAVYSRDGGTGLWHGSGLLVLTTRGSQVCALARFESHTLRSFGLPSGLDGDGQPG